MGKLKLLPGIKAVLFDLGNTLYDKRQYLTASFKSVVKHLNETRGIDEKSTLLLLNRIWKVQTSHYEFLFKDLLDILGIHSAKLLDEILNVYHNTKVKLSPYPGVRELLGYLKKHYKLGLVTDGNPVMQRHKIKSLGWEKQGRPFDVIVYTADYGKSYLKPNHFVYQLATEILGWTPEETVYVGDNPYDDFIGAKEIGIVTVRVMQGEFKTVQHNRDYEADMAINHIRDLRKIL